MADNSGSEAFQRGLRVEGMGADTRRLGSELSLEVWVRFFNATGDKIQVTGIDGSLTFGEGKERVELHPAAMERRFKAETLHLSGTIVVVEQPVPREIAERILAISPTHKIVFDSQALDIVVASVESPSKQARLPLWNLWEIHGDPAAPSPSQIITGNLNIQLKPVTAGEPTLNPEPKVPEKPLLLKLTDDELEKWVTPKAAIERFLACRVRQSDAVWSLVGRLKNGLLRAGAKNHVGGSPRTQAGVIEIEPLRWPSLQSPLTSRLWTTGDTDLWLSDSRSHESVSDGRSYFGIRFEPVGLKEMLEPLGEREADPPAASQSLPDSTPPPTSVSATPEVPKEPETEDDSNSRGPRVSDPHLNAWFDLFKTVYPGAIEEVAQQSARGMFPGKHVARKRVRDLLATLGPRKRGGSGRRNGE